MARSTTKKTRENRCRRLAHRQALALYKSRRRDPRAADFGRYTLVDSHNYLVGAQHMTLEEVERYLIGDGHRQSN